MVFGFAGTYLILMYHPAGIWIRVAPVAPVTYFSLVDHLESRVNLIIKLAIGKVGSNSP